MPPDAQCPTLAVPQVRGPARRHTPLRLSWIGAVRVECVEPILKEACSQVYPESAICVQRFDDSLNSAIRITYRISLRSSSLREPRYPLLRVVSCFCITELHSERGQYP
jgi:hypothetical protein